MKYILLIPIKLYWLLIPESKRRKCLFKKSCSNYVFEQVNQKGLFAGFRALKYRINNCNPNYNILDLEGELVLITKTDVVLKREELNETILN